MKILLTALFLLAFSVSGFTQPQDKESWTVVKDISVFNNVRIETDTRIAHVYVKKKEVGDYMVIYAYRFDCLNNLAIVDAIYEYKAGKLINVVKNEVHDWHEPLSQEEIIMDLLRRNSYMV